MNRTTNIKVEPTNNKFLSILDRPDLLQQAINLRESEWPEYIKRGSLTLKYIEDYIKDYNDFLALLCDSQEKVIAYGAAIPIAWDGSVGGLPDGWDAAYEQAFEDRQIDREKTTICALGIVISPFHKGKHLSYQLIGEIKKIGARHGLKHMLAPVRPTSKKMYPLTPIENYICWKRPDGTPFDPWIRAHWKMGGKILTVAPRSMLISGKVTDWENWTGMIFPESGNYIVPEALQPIRIDIEKDIGIYEDPNVWMEYSLD
ncbi:MAG: GNAT family N-acetyltransferase [Accumulibacter sp.]|jgi:hypothetical protein|uniref:GNAT family N-acetyltransferase n=1 Tax=Accumulibacter sp. TaxID=2053492 RepID=UPI002CF326B8|nr:GNAT family N-acetyltransferase [Candidatus Competibacter sp.]HRX60257.1 GNAT family N-acetyltransferase [Candidatus Competibacter sp.]